MNTVFTPFPVLTTERLLLRQLQATDTSAVFQLRSDPAQSEFLDRTLMQDLDAATLYIERMNTMVANGEAIIWAMQTHDSEAFLGTVCLWNFDQAHNQAELGYELCAHAQGQGFATEAVNAALTFGFMDMALAMVEGTCHRANARSCNVLTRCGFTQELVLRNITSRLGEPVPHHVFTMYGKDFLRYL